MVYLELTKKRINFPYVKYKNTNIVNLILIFVMPKYLNNGDIKIMSGNYKLVLENLKKNICLLKFPIYVNLIF